MRRRDLLKYLWLEAIALNCLNVNKAEASTWSYQGATGTDFWGEVAPEFQVCNAGQAQSPINIEPGVISEVGSLDLNYQDTPLKIVNNGRTIRVDYQPGSRLNLDGQDYELLQFHFHQPSEHLVLGQAADMEAHFVHQNQATGNLVVLAVLMSAGSINQALDSIWRQFSPSDAQAAQISDLTINALQLLPENSQQYYRYQGSLTTPPCSEIVTWLVLKQPVAVSRSQIERFLQVIGNNARPVQALNNRAISEFN
ncbi:MAG: carbonic anhydrase family protein [Cyanobacteria bacterium P01_A01_bin.40]